MTRHLALLLALCALLTAPLNADPHPRGRMRVAVHADQAGAIIWIVYSVTTVGVDSVSVATSGTGQTTVSRMYKTATVKDSVSMPKPLPLATISGSVIATAFRRARTASGTAPWSYTEPDAPPPAPTITVKVVPTAFTLPPHGSQQFCAFVCYGLTGHCAQRAAERTLAVCTAEYLKLPGSTRAVTPLEQRDADARCIAWTATGGTLSADVCAAGSPLVGGSPV